MSVHIQIVGFADSINQMLFHFGKNSCHYSKFYFLTAVIRSVEHLWAQKISKICLKNALPRGITLKAKLQNLIEDWRLWINIWCFFNLAWTDSKVYLYFLEGNTAIIAIVSKPILKNLTYVPRLSFLACTLNLKLLHTLWNSLKWCSSPFSVGSIGQKWSR